jgi:hypothetical protein
LSKSFVASAAFSFNNSCHCLKAFAVSTTGFTIFSHFSNKFAAFSFVSSLKSAGHNTFSTGFHHGCNHSCVAAQSLSLLESFVNAHSFSAVLELNKSGVLLTTSCLLSLTCAAVILIDCIALCCALGSEVTFGVSVTVGVDVLPDCVEAVEDASCFCLAFFAFCISDWIIS